jgi:hypothetical protein
MKREMSVSIIDNELKNAGELKKLLETVPDDASIWISTHKGDYNYSDYHTVEFNWTVKS